MKFHMTHPIRVKPDGSKLWRFYEAGKRWPFYNGHVWAHDFDTAHRHFQEFVASARKHRLGAA